jgi:hypothetical protein
VGNDHAASRTAETKNFEMLTGRSCYNPQESLERMPQHIQANCWSWQFQPEPFSYAFTASLTLLKRLSIIKTHAN